MLSKAHARGAYKKSEISRKQVLEAAVQALAKRGYARTSVGDIAAAAGMSKGAVHYHFESKDDLIARVLERCAAVARERVRRTWDGGGSASERIRRALAEMRAMRRDGSPEFRVLADLAMQGIHDAHLRQAFASLFEVNRSEVVAYLSKSLDDLGVVTKVPVAVILRLVLATLDGLALHDFFDPPDAESEAALDRALEMIAVGLFDG